MHRLRERLSAKKWENSDIKRTMRGLDLASSHHHTLIRHAATIISVIMILVGNFLASLVFIPLMLALDGWFLYALIAIVGFSLGLLFEILTRSIASLDHEHHVLLSILIPSVALLSVVYIVVFSNGLAMELGVLNTHNPYTIAATYALSFLLPYAHYKFVLKKHYYSG